MKFAATDRQRQCYVFVWRSKVSLRCSLPQACNDCQLVGGPCSSACRGARNSVPCLKPPISQSNRSLLASLAMRLRISHDHHVLLAAWRSSSGTRQHVDLPGEPRGRVGCWVGGPRR